MDQSFESFTAHAHEVGERFEERRKQFLKKLRFRCAVAAVLLLTFPIWFSFVTSLDNTVDGPLSSLSWLIVHIIAGFAIIVCIIAYAVMPLFRYRYYTVQLGNTLPGVSGVMQQHVSLKSEIFGQLLAYFGNFALYSDRKLTLKVFRDAPGMPDFDEFDSEDYIRGALDGVAVEMTEASLLVGQQREKLPIFSGLMIVLDINDANLVLRGKFSGRTVVIADRSMERQYVAEKYANFRHVALPEGFGQRFEAFTTDNSEAGRLLSSDFLVLLLKLSDTIRNARNQVRHSDDRFAYAVSSIANGLGDVIAVFAKGLMNWFKTGRFRDEATRREMQLAETKVTPDAKGFNASVHCAFYEDKVLVTIPYQHNLFEPDSIFHPPLHEDDIKLVYDLMSSVRGMSQAVVGALPKEMV